MPAELQTWAPLFINVLVEQLHPNSKFFSALRVLFPSFGKYKLEKAALYLSVVMEQEFNITMQTSKILLSEVNNVASVVLQNRCALDTLTAQHGVGCGGACAIIGEECCFFVN